MLGTWLHNNTYQFRCNQCIMARTATDNYKHVFTILRNWQLWDIYRYPDDKAAADLRLVLAPGLHSSLSSASKTPSIKDSRCSLLKAWAFRSVTQPNTPVRLFCSPSICVNVFIAQGRYVRTGMDNADDDSRDCPRNVRLLAIILPDAAASPRTFYWIRSPWKF